MNRLPYHTQAPETFHCDGWMYEEKCDGWRSLAYKEGERIRLISCNAVGDIAAAITKLFRPHAGARFDLRTTLPYQASYRPGSASMTSRPAPHKLD